MKTKEQIVMISKKEYEGMKDTIEVLQDPDMIKQILESEKNIKKGIKTWQLAI